MEIEGVTELVYANNRKATVFILDEIRSSREALVALVKSIGLNHECFESIEELLSSSKIKHAGCVVTNYQIKERNGIELLEELSVRNSVLTVVILNENDSIPLAVQAIRSGAVAYLQKPCCENELSQSIKSAIERNSFRLKSQLKKELMQNAISSLSVQELNTLKQIIAGKTNKQISEEVDRSLRTIEAERSRIKEKLGLKSTAELVAFYIHAREAEVIQDPKGFSKHRQ